MEAFDEVYVVSDLHLGGDIGHQIFKGGDLLRDLLRLAAANDAEAVAPAATPAGSATPSACAPAARPDH